MTLDEQAKAASTERSEGEPARVEAQPDYYDQLIRLKAEFENYRKRVDREKPEYIRLGKVELLFKLLPIYDELRLAHEHLSRALKATDETTRGLDAIFKKFEKLFKEEGVSVMDPLGKPFDALQHEVLGTVEKQGVDDGAVVEVLQPGFMLGDKVLRSAKVRIVKNKQGE